MQSPLDAEHRALGGRMVPFAGWDMPLRYGSVLDEHRACRAGAVVFDVSHMGSLWVRGPGAVAALQGLFTNDLGRVGPGRAQYTHLLDGDASVVDDLIVWWVGPRNCSWSPTPPTRRRHWRRGSRRRPAPRAAATGGGAPSNRRRLRGRGRGPGAGWAGLPP